MSRVPEKAAGAGQKQLKPAMMGGAETILGTIVTAEFRDTTFGLKTVLTLKEYDDVELRVGKRGTDRLIQKFGNETDAWIGEVIPLVKKREEVGNQTHIVYQVAPVEEWPELLAAAKKATKAAKAK